MTIAKLTFQCQQRPFHKLDSLSLWIQSCLKYKETLKLSFFYLFSLWVQGPEFFVRHSIACCEQKIIFSVHMKREISCQLGYIFSYRCSPRQILEQQKQVKSRHTSMKQFCSLIFSYYCWCHQCKNIIYTQMWLKHGILVGAHVLGLWHWPLSKGKASSLFCFLCNIFVPPVTVLVKNNTLFFLIPNR